MKNGCVENHTLARLRTIDKNKLKTNQYTLSLLNEALSAGLLNRQEINNIQMQFMQILRNLITRYTKGESSSVTADAAESLLNSVLFCIDTFTLSCSSPEEAITHLKKTPMQEIYESGVDCVRHWFDETGHLYAEVRKTRLKVGLEAYDTTILEGIPPFFRKYGILFDAHNTAVNIDYPLAFDDMSIRGVLYLKNYLEHLQMENQFCRCFSEQEIIGLLRNFGRMIGMDYKIELLNLFEQVFNHAVFAILSGNSDNQLLITESQFSRINERLKRMPAEKITALVSEAVGMLIENTGIDSPKLMEYIHRYETVFTERIVNAAENGCLHSIVATEREEKPAAPLTLFSEGERMRDADFISLVKKLVKLPAAEDKIRLIKSDICSLHDFIDLLDTDCLFGEEFQSLFHSLDSMELAILVKIVFYEEFRGNSFTPDSIPANGKVFEAEWQIQFVDFLRKLDTEKMKSLESCFGEIDYEEIRFD